MLPSFPCSSYFYLNVPHAASLRDAAAVIAASYLPRYGARRLFGWRDLVAGHLSRNVRLKRPHERVEGCILAAFGNLYVSKTIDIQVLCLRFGRLQERRARL